MVCQVDVYLWGDIHNPYFIATLSGILQLSAIYKPTIKNIFVENFKVYIV